MLFVGMGPGCALVSDAQLAARLDLDGDGISRPADCDDDDATIGGEEQWFVDEDGDGYGSSATVARCPGSSGISAVTGDCDDADAAIFPGAPETCNLLDDDCDTVADDGVEPPTWYLDGDGDGYGADYASTRACTAPDGYIARNGDCNDLDVTLNPETEWHPDRDGDGYGDPDDVTLSCQPPEGLLRDASDCDDTRADVSPDAVEACDEARTDEDCDGLADDEDVEATGKRVWYADADADGYGAAAETDEACHEPPGYSDNRQDCDDADDAVTTDCRWVKVSAGRTHTCGLRHSGVVQCWGSNGFGEGVVPPGTFVDVAAGTWGSCAITRSGALACWGSGTYGAPDVPPGTYIEVSMATSAACALAEDGSISCWGRAAPAAPEGTGLTSVSLSQSAGCALGSDGTVTGWDAAGSLPGPFVATDAVSTGCAGLDASGEIDDSADTNAGEAPAGPFTSFSMGSITGCALDAAGTATCWGYDDWGEATAPPGPFASLSVGSYHVCAVTTDGFLECWGLNDDGEATPPSD